MTEILHAWAIAPAAVGTCCLAADRGRVRWPELAASFAMLLAMLDGSFTRLLPNLFWALLLIGAAIALSALRSPRRGRSRGGARAGDTAMLAHTALGMIAMAALQLAMAPSAAASVVSAHAHGAGAGGTLDALVVGGAVAYAVFSLGLVRAAHTWLDRAQFLAMGTAVAVMALGALR